MGADLMIQVAPDLGEQEYGRRWTMLRTAFDEDSIRWAISCQAEPWVEEEECCLSDCEQLFKAIDRLLPIALKRCTDEYRDVTSIDLGTGNFWVTGGMSAGDNPTEAWDLMCLLNFIDWKYRETFGEDA